MGLVVQRMDNTIHWINHYSMDNVQFVLLTLIHLIMIYPVDSIIHPLNNWGQDVTSKVHNNATILRVKINLFESGKKKKEEKQ